MRYVLSIYAIGGIIGAFWLDWRVALLMISVWWADNLVSTLTKRDSDASLAEDPSGAEPRSGGSAGRKGIALSPGETP